VQELSQTDPVALCTVAVIAMLAISDQGMFEKLLLSLDAQSAPKPPARFSLLVLAGDKDR